MAGDSKFTPVFPVCCQQQNKELCSLPHGFSLPFDNYRRQSQNTKIAVQAWLRTTGMSKPLRLPFDPTVTNQCQLNFFSETRTTSVLSWKPVFLGCLSRWQPKVSSWYVMHRAAAVFSKKIVFLAWDFSH